MSRRKLPTKMQHVANLSDRRNGSGGLGTPGAVRINGVAKQHNLMTVKSSLTPAKSTIPLQRDSDITLRAPEEMLDIMLDIERAKHSDVKHGTYLGEEMYERN